jgi:molecular chaperone DnaK (HSP70)
LLARSLDAVQRACRLVHALDLSKLSDLLDSAAVTAWSLQDAAATLDRVVLVGGVTKMPLIRRQLADVFGLDRLESESVIEPVSAVAVGAGYPHEPQHYSLAYPPIEFVLRLVLQRDLGLKAR